MRKYKVGQILYLIGESSTRIVPIQVIEEVVRTTVNGTEKTYTVQMPDKKKTSVDIKKIKGVLFETKEALRKHMLTNATVAIDTMISDCNILVDSIFKKIEKKQQDKVQTKKKLSIDENSVQYQTQDDIIKVELGNGEVGTFKSSDLEKLGV